MAILSTCRNFGQYARHGFLNLKQTRAGGHGNTMEIRPTLWHWYKFKDLLHLYIMVGLIPCWMFAGYMNIRHGPAKLAEIPEGYRPEFWEYQRLPVTRFFAKHLYVETQRYYEAKMGYLYSESEKVIMNRIKDQVRNVMEARKDYEAWYFQPMYLGKKSRIAREHYFDSEHKIGTKEPLYFREEGRWGTPPGGYETMENPYGEGYHPDGSKPPGLFNKYE